MATKMSVTEIDRRIAELKVLRKDAVAAERKADKEAESKAVTALGQLVLSMYPDGWTTVDFTALSEGFKNTPDLFATAPSAPRDVAIGRFA